MKDYISENLECAPRQRGPCARTLTRCVRDGFLRCRGVRAGAAAWSAGGWGAQPTLLPCTRRTLTAKKVRRELERRLELPEKALDADPFKSAISAKLDEVRDGRQL